jgi:hypothetical protein
MRLQSIWRQALLSGVVLALAAGASAQQPATNFEQLSVLVKDGDRVAVSGTSGGVVEGKILDLSLSTLTLKVDGHPQKFLLDDVRTISRQQHANVHKAAWWGFGIGATVGLLALPATECRLGPDCARTAAMMSLLNGGIFAGIGAGFAAATVRDKVIFERQSGVKLSFAPVVGRERAAMLLTARW